MIQSARRIRANKSKFFSTCKRVDIYSYRSRKEQRRKGGIRDKRRRERGTRRKGEAAFLSSEEEVVVVVGRGSRSQMRHERGDKGGKAAGHRGSKRTTANKGRSNAIKTRLKNR